MSTNFVSDLKLLLCNLPRDLRFGKEKKHKFRESFKHTKISVKLPNHFNTKKNPTEVSFLITSVFFYQFVSLPKEKKWVCICGSLQGANGMGHPVLFLFVLGYSFVSFFYLWDWQLNDAWRAPLRAQARANTFANSEGAVSALDVRKLNWLMCSKSSSHSLASSNSGPKHWLSYCLYITKVSCNLVPVIAVIYLNFTIVSQFYWYVLLKIVICFPSKEKKRYKVHYRMLFIKTWWAPHGPKSLEIKSIVSPLETCLFCLE